METSNCDGQPRRQWVAWEIVPSVLSIPILRNLRDVHVEVRLEIQMDKAESFSCR